MIWSANCPEWYTLESRRDYDPILPYQELIDWNEVHAGNVVDTPSV